LRVHLSNTLIQMEKELGVPKPSDLFIGVIDFFAVLVPGIIAAAMIVIVEERGTNAASRCSFYFRPGNGWVGTGARASWDWKLD
jgi:hypothetical protein